MATLQSTEELLKLSFVSSRSILSLWPSSATWARPRWTSWGKIRSWPALCKSTLSELSRWKKMNSITLACMQSVNINYIFWPIWCLCSLTKEIVIGNNSYCGECKVNSNICLLPSKMIHFLDNQSANKNTPSKKIHADHVETWQVHQKPNIYPKKNNCDAVHGHMQKYFLVLNTIYPPKY